MDIQQIMALLAGQQGGGGMAPPSPLGALQPGPALPVSGMAPGVPMGMAPGMTMAGPPMPPPAMPDFNALLQQELVNQQAEQASQGRLGAGGGMNPAAMAGDVQARMMQEIANLQQGGMSAPQGFGAGNMQPRPPGGMGGAPGMTRPANVATLPMGGVPQAY